MDASGETPARTNALIRAMARWGGFWMGLFALLGGLWYIVSSSSSWVFRSMMPGGARLGRAAVVAQMVRVGVKSIAIVLVVSSCIGLILAMSMYTPL
ncbi:MAG: hypothetical protein MK089_13035, partial [Phycisphaerales bacterium]|nr:hypothetical protein [Phycisphaerales bacterium]